MTPPKTGPNYRMQNGCHNCKHMKRGPSWDIQTYHCHKDSPLVAAEEDENVVDAAGICDAWEKSE